MKTIRVALGFLLVWLFSSPFVCADQLIVNGGFETGDFSGWTVSGTMEYYGLTHSSAHTGLWGAWFGDITGLTYISQMIPTDVGQSYLLTFYIKNYVTPGEEVVDRGELWWGGTLIDSGTNAPSFDWQQNSYHLTATTSSTEVKLGFNNPPGYWRLDDISVSTVPEPTSLLLLGTGLGVLGLAAWRKRK